MHYSLKVSRLHSTARYADRCFDGRLLRATGAVCGGDRPPAILPTDVGPLPTIRGSAPNPAASGSYFTGLPGLPSANA